MYDVKSLKCIIHGKLFYLINHILRRLSIVTMDTHYNSVLIGYIYKILTFMTVINI